MFRTSLIAAICLVFWGTPSSAQTCYCDPQTQTECLYPGLEIVSTNSMGLQAPSRHSRQASISADGRWVVFRSESRFFAGEESHPEEQIYLKDLVTGTLTQVTTGSNGAPGTFNSYDPIVSADGRRVAYVTPYSGLPDGSAGARNVFVYDHATGDTTLVSASPSGQPGNHAADLELAFSPDGTELLFVSLADNLLSTPYDQRPNLFRADLLTGTLELIEPTEIEGRDDPTPSAIREPYYLDNGYQIAYLIYYSNGQPNGQVVLHDLDTDQTEVLTEAIANVYSTKRSPVFSNDGRYLLFLADDLSGGGDLHAYVKDLHTGSVEIVSRTSSGDLISTGVREASLSANGRYVALTTDSGDARANSRDRGFQTYLYDRTLDTLTPVSTAFDGERVTNNTVLSRFAFADTGQLVFEGRSANYVATDTNGTRADIFFTQCTIAD
jgi:Tol biopolymer transport system component